MAVARRDICVFPIPFRVPDRKLTSVLDRPNMGRARPTWTRPGRIVMSVMLWRTIAVYQYAPMSTVCALEFRR